MKHYFFYYLFLLSCVPGIAQMDTEIDKYYFHVTISDPESLVVTRDSAGELAIRNPNDIKETAIFSGYRVFEFEPAFKTTRLDDLKKVYRIVTNRVELLGGLMKNYPEKYTRIDQYYPDEDSFYPNDYGTTSPVENLGAAHPLHDLDLINAAGAWGITRGSSKVVVGISDSKIDSTNADMKDRIKKYLYYFKNAKGMICAHGTNVAAIAIGRMNNAYGRPGICSDCEVVVNNYGGFNYVEELVAAGARVINTSWARCNMGAYHENIEARINELYEDGIMIVAGAGNGKNCNPDDDYAPDDYAYPASYEKVISVTGVYTMYDKAEDNTYIGKEGRPTAGYLKDRHSSEYGIKNDGTLHPKYRKWDMQFNRSIDFCAPAQSYLLGHDWCGEETVYGGATSNAAPYITGVIGLMWSVNYCLDAYETESVLKLTSAYIDDLPGNEYYKGQLGAGRVDAYRAVKMARDMKELMGKVQISGRDFSRFNFKLEHAPYDIEISNQTFRDSSTVDFKARNRISLKPGTRLAPDATGNIRLSIDPQIPTDACFPKPVKEYPSVYNEGLPMSGGTTTEKSFTVRASKNPNKITVVPLKSNEITKAGTAYVVMVRSPLNVELLRKEFHFPDVGEIEMDFAKNSYLVIEINIDGQKEIYRVKKP